MIVWSGSPSHRDLAKRAGPLMRPPQTLSKSTISDVFLPGRRRLNQDLVVAIVRALEVDEAEVDRWRQACLRVHAGARSAGPAGVLRQLPADLATFTGREKVLDQLTDAAVAPGSTAPTVVITAIEGMGGVGKTQLAVHLAHRLIRAGRFADGQLYVNLRGFDPKEPPADPAAVLDSFLRALGVSAPQIPHGLDERAAMFRDRVGDRRILILLDNAADEQQVRELIPAGSGPLVLITSRRSLAGLDGAVTHRLGVFDPGEAVALLARIAGAERVVDADPAGAAEIAELCGYLPLAVALAAAQLRAHPSWTLTDQIRRLRGRGVEGVRAGGRAVHPVFELSYNGLPSQVRRIFRLLGHHPGSDIAVAAVAALADTELAEAEAAMELLHDEHLVGEITAGRYELHDLLREYAAGLRGDDPMETQEALTRLVSWYFHSADAAARVIRPGRRHAVEEPVPPGPLRSAFDTVDAAQAWLDAEYRNLLAVQSAALSTGQDAVVAGLPLALWDQFNGRGKWDDWIAASTMGLDAARRIPDPRMEVSMLMDIGSALYRAGRLDEAIDRYQVVIRLCEQQGDITNEIIGRINLGSAYLEIHQYKRATPILEAALAMAGARGDKRNQASASEALGEVAASYGDHASELVRFRTAIGLRQDLGDRVNEAYDLARIGNALRHLGQTAEALECLHGGIIMNRAVRHAHAEAAAWGYLAEALEDGGDPRGAVAAFTMAKSLFDGIDVAATRRVESRLVRLRGGLVRTRAAASGRTAR